MAKGKRRRRLKRGGRRAKERDAPVVQLEKAKPRPYDLGNDEALKYVLLTNFIRIVCEFLAEQLHNL